MTALVRYVMATTLHTQRYLAPALLYLTVVVVATRGDSGPLPPLYGLLAGALLPCAAWLTMAVISVEDPGHYAITVVTAGRPVRVLLACVCVALICCLALTLAGLGLPLLLGHHDVGVFDLVLAAEAHLVCACVGVAVGLLCSRLLIPRQGHALLIAVVAVMVAILVPGSPANTLLRKMTEKADPAALVPWAAVDLAMGLAVLGAAVVVTERLASRRR